MENYSAPSDELMKLLKEVFEYSMTNVHISFPGVVESYDPKTRRADIQPSIKKRLPNGEFLDLPVLPDVPVKFPGTKKYTIHIMLEKGDEVDVRVGERSTDKWRDTGGKGIEDEDPRRFSLNDCWCSPGLQPVEFIAVEEAGLNIVHKTDWDGNFVSSLTMDDDKVEVKYKEKADVLMEDDHILAKTEKCSADMTAQVVTVGNGELTAKLNGAKASLKNKSKSLFTILDTFLNTLKTTNPTTMGSPAQHTWNPAIAQNIATTQAELGMIMEA